jgi:hypothetical protein
MQPGIREPPPCRAYSSFCSSRIAADEVCTLFLKQWFEFGMQTINKCFVDISDTAK